LSWNYGKSSPLDEIWVTYPDAFAFSNNKKTVGFTVMPNQKVVNKIISFFLKQIHKTFLFNKLIKQTHQIITSNLFIRPATIT
jgi:hypothetical protein